MRIAVLGAGMVGRAVAADLSGSHSVVSADIDPAALERLGSLYGIDTVTADLRRGEAVARVVREADMVVNAVPGLHGLRDPGKDHPGG